MRCSSMLVIWYPVVLTLAVGGDGYVVVGVAGGKT